MAEEPIDTPIPTPRGGWPKAMLRLELTTPCTLDEAVYEVASASRLNRRGVVAHFNGVDLWAFPHQSVSEIGRTYDHLRDAIKNGTLPPIIIERWTPQRKMEVLNAIAAGAMKRSTVLDIYGLSEDELQGWETAFHARGIDGLSVLKMQEGGR